MGFFVCAMINILRYDYRYIFIKGNALMETEHTNTHKIEEVTSGSIILIEDNDFHRVHNKTGESVEFICIFNGKRSH